MNYYYVYLFKLLVQGLPISAKCVFSSSIDEKSLHNRRCRVQFGGRNSIVSKHSFPSPTALSGFFNDVMWWCV